MKMTLDAENMVAGRLASVAARHLLHGMTVTIVNAEKAVITGKPEATLRLYREKVERGDPYHGPFYPREPDRILKRIVRGMINYHEPRGREAFRRLHVHIGAPVAAGKAFRTPEAENRAIKVVSLGELAQIWGK